MRYIVIIGLILLVGCNTYPEYVIKNGDSACEYCFKNNMVSYSGGSAWSIVQCDGDYNALTLWSDSKPNEAQCHNRDWECKESSSYKYSSTLWDYNCSKIELFIELNHYPSVNEKYHFIGCITNKSMQHKETSTGSCKECKEDIWKSYYLKKCT